VDALLKEPEISEEHQRSIGSEIFGHPSKETAVSIKAMY
jgi:hypothetical protein